MQIRINQAIAAGATVNVLAGQQFEFLPYNAAIAIGTTGSAAGLLASFFAGTSLLQQESQVGVETAANRGPIFPDDFTLRTRLKGGTRLQGLVRNPTAGALTVTMVLAIDPI